MKSRPRATQVTIHIHPNAITHTRRKGVPSVAVQKKSGRKSEHLLTLGLGKNASTARVTRNMTAAEFERVKHAIMNALNEMGKNQGKKTAAQRYSMLTRTGHVRQRQWRKTYEVQQPLRVMVPLDAGIVVQHFDALASESTRVERLRQWKRVEAFGRNVANMVRNLFFQYTASGKMNRFTRDTLEYINKPFITNDPEFFSFILAQFPSITAARQLLEKYHSSLGRKKYADTLRMLGEWHARQRTIPRGKTPLLEFFVRKRMIRDSAIAAYDFYPRPHGWRNPEEAPF